MLVWMMLTSDVTVTKASPIEVQIIKNVNSMIVERWPASFVNQAKAQQLLYTLTDPVSFWHGAFEVMLRNLIGEQSRKTHGVHVSQ
jgi:hypothetical protein